MRSFSVCFMHFHRPSRRTGFQLHRQRRWELRDLSLIAILLLICGSSLPISNLALPQRSESSVNSTEVMTIALGQVETTPEGLQITLSGTEPFSYHLANHDQPLQLTIDVPQARVTQPARHMFERGGIEAIRLNQVRDVSNLARLEIDLQDRAAYSVSKEQEHLVIKVRAPDQTSGPQLHARAVPASDEVKSSATAAPPLSVAGEYKIGAGDVLAVTVYDEPDLTQQRRVNERGVLDFPLIGEVEVTGLTSSQVADRLEDRLFPRYLRNPQVFVDVAEFASKKVFIVGAVDKPATLTLRGETTLLEVLSQTNGLGHSSTLTVFRRASAQGTQDGADNRNVQAIRVDLNGLLHRGDISGNLVLQPQDVIYIPKPDAVFVFGEVHRTGPIPLPDGGISMIEAINQAGGFSEFAASHRTRVLRVVDGRERVIQVDMAAVIRGDLGKDITLRSNDIVIVPASVF